MAYRSCSVALQNQPIQREPSNMFSGGLVVDPEHLCNLSYRELGVALEKMEDLDPSVIREAAHHALECTEISRISGIHTRYPYGE